MNKRSARELLLANRVAKKTKKRHKRMERALTVLKVRVPLETGVPKGGQRTPGGLPYISRGSLANMQNYFRAEHSV